MSVRIIVDSACDLLPEEAKELGIDLLPLKTFFGEEEFLDGVTLNHDQFFEKLIETDIFPTTSQITPFEYGEVFRKIVDDGDTAVCITLSSKLSGCYQSAYLAASEYEDKIFVVDSENACIGEQVLARLAARLAKSEMSAKDIACELDIKKKNIRILALMDTLEYLKKGGRISSAAALAGNILSIKPVISIINGEIVVVGKARGSKAGNNMLTEMIKKEGAIDFEMPYALAYTGLSDATLKKYINDYVNVYKEKTTQLPISSVGCAIGTHIGPGAIAVSFFVK